MTYSSDEADENQQMNVTATSNDSDSDEGQDNDDVTSQQSMEVDESVQEEEEEEEESSLVPSQESPFNEEGDEDGDSEDNGDDDDGGDDDNEDNEDAHDDNEDAHDDNEDADMDSDDEEEEVNTDKVTNFDTTGSILETSMDIDDNDQSNDEHDNDQSNDDPNNKADASEEEDDSNMENGDSNGNDADASILNVAAAASGKVLIRPSNMTSDDDDNDDNDEDIEETLNGNSHNKDEAIDTSLDQEKPSPTDDNVIAATEESEVTGVTETSTPIQPAVLSGKPLALAVAAIDDDSSSDDELLMSHKTTKVKKSTTRKASTSTKKKASTPSSKSTKKRKKRTVTAVAEVVEDDAIEAVAVVGDGSDSDTVEAVVIPQAPPKKKRKKPGPKPKKKPNDGKKTTSKKKPTVVDKGKSKKKKSSNGNDSDSDGSCYAASVIPHERMRAAETAREILMNSVQRTPFVMSESHTVRNFGRIKIEEKNTLETSYCNAAAIYPVGFSCDRYEFSPVHGRFLKLRCDILDGETDDKSKESNTSKNDNGNKKKGPIFRIMWGRGIDEIDSLQTFPFDLYSSSTPIVNQVDAVAVPAGKDVVKIKPEQGMRVKVRFENNLWYLGNILQVSVKKQSKGSDKKSTRAAASSKKDKKPKYDVQIMYDNGVIEDITFPDPDIVLVAPGANDVADGCLIDVKEVRGKPVNTVLGTTPLLAWAKTLTKLGLIDEIIYEKAVQSISHARNEGLAEFKKQRQHLKKDFNGASEVGNSPGKKSKSDTAEKETLLRQRLDELSKEYEEQLSKSQATAIELAEARLQSLGPFYTNPFFNSDTSINQQKQWLTTIIKKEKSKIGSTGNKRKIVTATDLLERTATFYNIDIERLLEGLPGSEFCPGYVFHSLRSSASSALALIHEEQVRREKEKQKTKSKAPKAKKVTKDVKAELIDEREKELKRKARDDEREERKKQRLEEMDQVKKEREFNRLTRLSTQIDEKLFKESCTQRERVTFLATKLIGKEIARRRKAAEIVVSHSIGNTIEVQSNYKKSHCRLPTLSSIYHPDVVRLWNFLTTFKGAFDNLDSTDVPSLEKLQEIIDILNNRETDKDLQRKARAMLTKIAVALCTPMTKSLIKTLSSALASALQDNKGDKVDEDAQSAVSVENDPDSFPIDENTWKEFARLTFITDALSDLGYTKIEQTHIIRGHRTGGHPNSKEAKRVKRGEDFALVLRRQALTESDSQKDLNPYEVKVTIPSPCQPSATPSDWVYYLHNVKSLPSNAATGIKSNLKKALSLLKSATYLGDERDGIEKALQRNISLLEGIGTTVTAPTETINICKNVHQDILGILDSATAEHQSQKDKIHPSESSCNQKKNTRLRAGVYAHLNLSEETYKKIENIERKLYI